MALLRESMSPLSTYRAMSPDERATVRAVWAHGGTFRAAVATVAGRIEPVRYHLPELKPRGRQWTR